MMLLMMLRMMLRRACAAVLATVLVAGCTATVTGSPAGPESPENPDSTGPSGTTVTIPSTTDALTGVSTRSSSNTGAPSSAGMPGTPGPTSSPSTSTTGPRVTVVLEAAGVGDPSPADLRRSAAILRERVAPIPGATVTIRPLARLVLRAPGTDLAVFDELVRPGLLNLRPVLATWLDGGSGTSPTDSGSGASSATGTDAFPPGSDPRVPTQPRADTAAGWKRWRSVAKGYESGSGAPSCDRIDAYRGLDDPAKPVLACDTDGDDGYLLGPTLIKGTAIAGAEAAQELRQGWTITVTFDARAQRRWADYTAQHIGRQVAFTLDGGVLSAPQIGGPITTAGTMISGSFTETEAKDLARWLDSGALPVVFTVTSRRVVG